MRGTPSRDEALAAVAGFATAIELVDLDPDESDPEAILAADIYQRHVLLGQVAEDAALDGIAAVVSLNGEEAASTDDATEATGDPIGLVQHVARTLEAAGERLSAGEVVICGAVVPALKVQSGDAVEVMLTGLGKLSVLFE